MKEVTFSYPKPTIRYASTFVQKRPGSKVGIGTLFEKMIRISWADVLKRNKISTILGIFTLVCFLIILYR